MPAGLQFRVDQLIVDRHFKPASIRRDQRYRLDLWFEIFQQFGCQTGSAVCVMSNRTIFYLNLQEHSILPCLLYSFRK